MRRFSDGYLGRAPARHLLFPGARGIQLARASPLARYGRHSHAADLLDNASRGAQTAARFLERKPLGQADAGTDDRASALAEATDRAGTPAEATDRAGALANADDRDGALADTSDGTLAGSSVGETDKPKISPSMAARGPPPCRGIIQARSSASRTGSRSSSRRPQPDQAPAWQRDIGMVGDSTDFGP